MPNFDFTIIWNQLGYFVVGALYTISISILSMIIGILIGLVVCFGRMSKNVAVRLPVTGFLEVARGIPLLAFLIWFFYGLPMLLGVEFSPLFAGVACISLKYSAYLGEVFRSGLQAIEKGQSEAAFAVGYSKLQNMRYVVIPQAVRIVIPPIGNLFIGMIQDSSMVMVVGIWELMRRGNSIANTSLKPLEVYTTIAVFYLIITISVSRINRYLEGRLKIAR